MRIRGDGDGFCAQSVLYGEGESEEEYFAAREGIDDVSSVVVVWMEPRTVSGGGSFLFLSLAFVF